MVFFARHGALAEERTLGQKFLVDLELATDLSIAGNSDRLEDTVCYDAVYHCIKQVMEEQTFQLIERLAEVIAQTLLAQYPILNAVQLTVKKPSVPINGCLDWAGVTIHRER